MVWSWGTFFTWVDILFAVGTFCWEDDWLGNTVSKSLSLWKVWAMFESIWINVGGSNWDVSWDDVLWPWGSNLTEGIWPWSSGDTWIHIWVAVESFIWEWNSFNDSSSKGFSFWSVWAVFKTSWGDGSSSNWNVWCDDVLRPWSSNLTEGIWPWGTGLSWIDIWDAVSTLSWPCDWNGGTVSKSLSLWSVWAMFKTNWVSWTSNVSWGNILWPWGVNLRKGPCWVAVESFFWIWDS